MYFAAFRTTPILKLVSNFRSQTLKHTFHSKKTNQFKVDAIKKLGLKIRFSLFESIFFYIKSSISVSQMWSIMPHSYFYFKCCSLFFQTK